MTTILDTINERRLNEGLPPIQDRGTSFLTDKLSQIQNSEGYTNENDLGSLTGAFGLGSLKMGNDMIFGGGGAALGGLGRLTEWLSPFSGEQITPDDAVKLTYALGYTPEQIQEMYPYEDSWLTSLAKGSLELQNKNDDKISEWRQNLLGDNPTPLAKMSEGAGTSAAYMGLAGLLSYLGGGFTPLKFALGMGGSEALAETGGFLGDAYRRGQYDNGALSTAGKNFLTNAALNSTLDYFLSPVGKVASKVANPVGRYLAGTGSQIINELLQEPSQQVIEQASVNSLNNGTGFLSELGESAKQWPEMFSQLAPEVAGSTLITQGLLALTPLGIPGNISYNRSLGDLKQRIGNVGEQLNNVNGQERAKLQKDYDELSSSVNNLNYYHTPKVLKPSFSQLGKIENAINDYNKTLEQAKTAPEHTPPVEESVTPPVENVPLPDDIKQSLDDKLLSLYEEVNDKILLQGKLSESKLTKNEVGAITNEIKELNNRIKEINDIIKNGDIEGAREILGEQSDILTAPTEPQETATQEITPQAEFSPIVPLGNLEEQANITPQNVSPVQNIIPLGNIETRPDINLIDENALINRLDELRTRINNNEYNDADLTEINEINKRLAISDFEKLMGEFDETPDYETGKRNGLIQQLKQLNDYLYPAPQQPQIQPVIDNYREFNTPVTQNTIPVIRNNEISTPIMQNEAPIAQQNTEPPRQIRETKPINQKSERVTTGAGTKADIKYRVVELDDLTISHSENGRPNPKFPSELQPRDRNRQANREQIITIGSRPDYDRLNSDPNASTGRPIVAHVNNRLAVISGNGRTLGLNYAYENGQGEQYKSSLVQNAEKFGFNPEEIEKMEKPVLVGELDSSSLNLEKFAKEANESNTAIMSDTETAVNDAKNISENMLMKFDTEKDLTQNKAFLHDFLATIPKNERANLRQSNGEWSKHAYERTRNALFQLAYNDVETLNTITENNDDDSKNLTNALINAAPRIAKVEIESYNSDLSIQKDIVDAVKTYRDAKQDYQTGKGNFVEAYLAQEDFSRQLISKEAKALANFFYENRRSAKKIINALIQYADSVKTQPRENDILIPGLEDVRRNKQDLLQSAFNYVENGGQINITDYADDTHTTQQETQQPEIKTAQAPEIKPKQQVEQPITKIPEQQIQTPQKTQQQTEQPITPKQTPQISEPQIAQQPQQKTEQNIEQQTPQEFQTEQKPVQKTEQNLKTEEQINTVQPQTVKETEQNLQKTSKGTEQTTEVKEVNSKSSEKTEQTEQKTETEQVIETNTEQAEQKPETQTEQEITQSPEQTSKNEQAPEQATEQQKKQRAKTREQLRQDLKNKLREVYRSEEEAEAMSEIHMASVEYFAKGQNIGINEMYNSLNLSFRYRPDIELTDNEGKVIGYANAQTHFRKDSTVIDFSKMTDASSVLHEFGHVYLKTFEKILKNFQVKKGRLHEDINSLLKAYNLKVDDVINNTDKWKTAQEKFARHFERYFFNNKAPNSRIKRAFDAFKNWLKHVYTSVKDIFYQDADGKTHKLIGMPDEVKQVFDNMLGGYDTEKSAPKKKITKTKANTQIEQDTQTPDVKEVKTGEETFNQYSNNQFSYDNEESERRWIEGEKGIKKPNILQRIVKFARDIGSNFKGEYSELKGNKDLDFAREQLKQLERKKSAVIAKTMKPFINNLKKLNSKQLELFKRKRFLDDLVWRKEQIPDAELPLGFSDEDLRREHAKFSKFVENDPVVKEAIETDKKIFDDLRKTYTDLAGVLGLNLGENFKNPYYFRHQILEYANAAAMGETNRKGRKRGKGGGQKTEVASIDDLFVSKTREFLGRDWRKHYKGSKLDYNLDYLQAMGEVVSQMAMDTATMGTLIEIKKKCDVAPKYREKIKQAFRQAANDSEGETHNQTEGVNLSDIIPEGYELFIPSSTRLIQSTNSVYENAFASAIDEISDQTHIPIDEILQIEGLEDEETFNQLWVIPTQLKKTLKEMSKNRDIGEITKAAHKATLAWKLWTIGNPLRIVPYNLRNLSGDLDAVIAGNWDVLKRENSGRAIKELINHFRGKETSQDLQDFLDRSGGELQIHSMQLAKPFSDSELKTLDKTAKQVEANGFSFKNIPRTGINAIKKFFDIEFELTQLRENWLRYAAYLAYKSDIDANNGTPSTWGASNKEDIMALTNNKDKAYAMANDLLGNYDNVSKIGKRLSDMLIPFWRWQEINLTRFYKLIRNGLKGENAGNFTKKLLIAQTAKIPFYAVTAASTFAKISLLNMAMNAFNRWFRKEDDDKLPKEVKSKPHLTFGNIGGKVYYLDRLGMLGDIGDWLGLDSIFLDAREIQSGKMSLGDYVKKTAQAPVGKIMNQLNPILKMPFELATSSNLYPDAFHPRPIHDNAKHIAQSLGLTWPYKALTREPRSDMDELTHILASSVDPDEAAYFQTLDTVRKFQERVLDKHFDGFASTKRGEVLRKLKTAMRYKDRAAVRRYLREYAQLDGTKKGLQQSMKAMNPLFGLSKEEQKQFLKWINDDDRRYLRKANRYFHALADRYIK